MESRVVHMDESGRLTVREEARRALPLSGAATFELEVDAAGAALLLRTAGAHSDDDFSITPEQLESLARGMKDSREGSLFFWHLEGGRRDQGMTIRSPSHFWGTTNEYSESG